MSLEIPVLSINRHKQSLRPRSPCVKVGMANSYREDRRSYRRRASDSEWANEHAGNSSGKERVTLDSEPEIPGVRRIRVERRDERDAETRQTASPRKMRNESHTTLPSDESMSSHRRRRREHRSADEEGHGRRTTVSRDDSPASHLYGTPSKTSHHSQAPENQSRRVESEDETSESEEEVTGRSKVKRKSSSKRKVRVVYITEDEYHSSKQEERVHKGEKKPSISVTEDDVVRRSRTHRSQRRSAAEPVDTSPMKRSSSTREAPSSTSASLRRGHSTSSHTPSTRQRTPSLSIASNTTGKRSSHFINNFFGPPVQYQHHEPERLVECLTCLSDDIPRSKSAKLKCGHRMCHDCLRRIFKLSVTDPQHMPPKCCTTDHIPLKHVERLFDLNFKKKWNRKFQEYSTKNRIYCPARRCGEWIKPGNIHIEDGKKYGKCGRCKTKVCCLCNSKWHGSRDCPKDEETNKLLAAAKEAGWQRCYSCRTMVELKEGCNHMTCRCTAQFCMICGLKWKSCNCPWFNYEAVEADRLNHMQIPQPAGHDGPAPRPHGVRRPRPNNYVEEIDQRRRQERADEGIARRLQNFHMDDDYQGGTGDIHGVENGAGHFMNQDYIRAAHNILTGTFDSASAAANYVLGVRQARGGPPPPVRRMSERYPVAVVPPAPPAPASPPRLRRHTMMGEAYNNAPTTRPSERIVPRRIRTDYASEAAVHAPYSRRLDRAVSTREGPNRIIPAPQVERSNSTRSSEREVPSPKTSVLAGLGTRRGGNRVSAWRSHVEPGVEPEEGMLSI